MEKEAQPQGVNIDPTGLALLDTVLAAIRAGAEQYLSQAQESEPLTPPNIAAELPRQPAEPSPLTRR